MRILVVQESDWLERGPHQSHHLMERLAQAGHEIRVVDYEIGWMKNLDRGVFSKKESKENAFKVVPPGVTVIRSPFIRLPFLSYISLLVSHRLTIHRELRDHRPDVIVGFGLLNARLAIRQGNRRGIPFVYYIIDELHRLVPETILHPIARFVEQGNNKRSSKVISINEALREYSEGLGADPSKTLVIRAGVDFERFASADGSEVRKRYGFTDQDTVMFFMGWLYDFSGLDEVAMEMARSKNKNLKMLVLGKGELWDRLTQIREKEGLGDRLILEGWKPYSEVPEYLAAADICLLPAKNIRIMQNIVPIKMYEYLAAGKVVFSTDMPGIRKEFQEGNGVIYINESKDSVSRAVDLISRAAVKSEGQKGQMFVKSNDWMTMTDMFEDVLRQVIQSRPTTQEFSKGVPLSGTHR
jgi:glycosyltransferase involved in cell wall biosynthesis